MDEDNSFSETPEKAAYNQSANITQLLGQLLGGYVIHMNLEEYDKAMKCIQRIVDIISAKVKDPEIKFADELIESVGKNLPMAMEKFNREGRVYVANKEIRKEVCDKIVELFRYINKLQDKYGYGMVSMDDPRMAVLKS